MAITPVPFSVASPRLVPEVPLCSAGRWVTHDEWPGWRLACPDPGEVALEPPYLLCRWHAADLSERAAEGTGEQ